MEDDIWLALVPPDHIELLQRHQVAALAALKLRLWLLSGHGGLGLALALLGSRGQRLITNCLVYRGSGRGLQVDRIYLALVQLQRWPLNSLAAGHGRILLLLELFERHLWDKGSRRV